MDLISGASLHGFPELVGSLRGDPHALLMTNGLSVEDCGRAEAFIPLRKAVQAVERAAVATATPDFGRRLADRQGIEILGALGLAARTANTFGEALGIFDRYMAAYSPGIAVHLVAGSEPDTAFLSWRLTLLQAPVHPQTTELSLGITLRVLRYLLGPGYRPVAVHLPHEPLTATADYVSYYGCRPTFGVHTAGFALSTADLDLPLTRDDTEGHQATIAQLSALLDDSWRSPAVRAVAGLVGPLLPAGAARVDVIARQLGMHPKALQRKLADEGASVTSIVDQVRRDLTERGLRDSDIGLTHLARQLGFAEQSVLTRACQRWFGTSPSAHRAALRARP
jgi:AraC-like DNA-binding protein